MGMNSKHVRFRVGGLGGEFGDVGSAYDIGIRAMQAAFRSMDGRGPETVLVSLVKERYALDRLDDLVEFFIVHSKRMGELDPGMLAPLVFEAARGGDPVSIQVLQWAGGELALSARAVARELFAQTERFPLVMGGSVLQKGSSPHLRDALVGEVAAEFPNAAPVVLRLPPVHGALRYALDVAREVQKSQWIISPDRDHDLLLDSSLEETSTTELIG